jgi:peptidoglycan/LPS O-acetylase OafA/YrhL
MRTRPAPTLTDARPSDALPVEGSGERAPFRLGHRRALDGLRGVAVLAVLAFHGEVPIARGGGFLITSLLYEEWRRTGAIRLRAFYARRELRLLPALLVLLVALLVYAMNNPWLDQRRRLLAEIVFTLLYVANWAQAFELVPPLDFLSHAWSLAIEEQFYLVWPLALLLLLRARIRPPRAIALLALGIVASALLRAHLWHGVGSFPRVFFGSDTRADAPLIGCLLGLALAWWGLPISWTGRLLARATAAVASVGLLALAMRASWLASYMYDGGFTLVAVAAVILGALSAPDGILGRVLATSVLVGLGRISYGVYLWHWPVFLALRPEVVGWGAVPTAILRLTTTLAVAGVSFRVRRASVPPDEASLQHSWYSLTLRSGEAERLPRRHGSCVMPYCRTASRAGILGVCSHPS